MKGLLAVAGLAALMTWAGSQGGQLWAGWPVFAVCALLAFGLQWLAFLPAYWLQTEKFYDLTGSLTYIAVTGLAVVLSTAFDSRSLLLAILIGVWAARLGSFLFLRIRRDGSDSRFERIKPSALRFFLTWNLQGLWVLFTAACALAAITGTTREPLTPLDLPAVLIWLLGFVIEVVADRQKQVFRRTAGATGFIQTGLWSRSRHPNYFGEIILWIGIALLALPALDGWRYLTLLSPLFVFLLLTRVSGIPLLERKAEQRWGKDPAYRQYRDRTPRLLPRFGSGK